MNIYDTAQDVIKDLNRVLSFLPAHLLKEIDNAETRQAAGWLVEDIETKLVQIEKICKKD